jgi:hypothetical protein
MTLDQSDDVSGDRASVAEDGMIFFAHQQDFDLKIYAPAIGDVVIERSGGTLWPASAVFDLPHCNDLMSCFQAASGRFGHRGQKETGIPVIPLFSVLAYSAAGRSYYLSDVTTKEGLVADVIVIDLRSIFETYALFLCCPLSSLSYRPEDVAGVLKLCLSSKLYALNDVALRPFALTRTYTHFTIAPRRQGALVDVCSVRISKFSERISSTEKLMMMKTRTF